MFKKLGLLFLWFAATPVLLVFATFLLYDQSKTVPIPVLNYPVIISEAENINSLDGQVLGIQVNDIRPYIVERFLEKTPLESYAKLIVDTSDKYDIDYRLIPAIAMKESGAGIAARSESYNAWGFENGRTNFESWEQSIEIVAKTLREKYFDRGLDSPEEIMAVYAPPQLYTGGKWAKDINFFFSQMQAL